MKNQFPLKITYHVRSPEPATQPLVRLLGLVIWLTLAACGQAQFTQSYTNHISPGVSFIANQLDHGSNTLYDLFPPPTLPDGIYLTIYSQTVCGSSNSYYYESDLPGDGWATDASGSTPVDPRTVSLPAGTAAMVLNTGAAFDLTFTGTPHVPVLPTTLPCGYGNVYMLGRQTNGVGTYENVTGLAPQQSAQVQRWNGSGYDTYSFLNGAWVPTTPTLNIGEAARFFIPSTNVQTYTLNLQTGYNLIANQLDHGSNTLTEVLPNVPAGSILYKFDNSAGTWTAASFNSKAHAWIPRGLTLNPGEGAFLQSPSNFTCAFTGNPHVPVLPVTITNGATFLLSRQTNDLGNYTGIVGSDPLADQSRIYKWTGSDYTEYTYGNTGWEPSEPTAAVGEPLWISQSSGSPPSILVPPLLTQFPISQRVERGSNATFSVSAICPTAMTYQWYKDSVVLPGATRALLIIPSVSATNAGYYHVAVSNPAGASVSPMAFLYITPGGGSPDLDFGDMPARYGACWRYYSYSDYPDCYVQTTDVKINIDASVNYPTFLKDNGARHSLVGDPLFLGNGVTGSQDGTPSSNAHGDPTTVGFPTADFSAAGILAEENGIRWVQPFVYNFSWPGQPADPRFSPRGITGRNLFGGDGCYAQGSTVYFTVEAYNLSNVGVFACQPLYLNVWIDYGNNDNGTSGTGVDGAPDGIYQPEEYVIKDQPLWGVNLLQYLYRGLEPTDYPYDTHSESVRQWVNSDFDCGVVLPDIGVQPYAPYGLQLCSFTIPPMPTSVECGKQTFARFRISRYPLGLTGANPPNYYNLPDPAHGLVTDGEVEDYPMYITKTCGSSVTGWSSLCLGPITMPSYLSIVTAVASPTDCILINGPLPDPLLIGLSSSLDLTTGCEMPYNQPNPPYDPEIPGITPFSAQVANSGSSNLTGVVVTYLVPANAVFYAASATQGTWTQQLGTVTFNLGELDAGQVAHIGLNVMPRSSGVLDHEFHLAADQPLLNPQDSIVHVPNFVAIAGTLVIKHTTNNVTLSWPNDGWTLQQSASLASPWTTAPSQVSPYTLPANEAKSFYRLSRPY